MHKKCSLNIVFLDFLLSLRCNVKCIKQVVMNSEIILEINGYKCNLLKYKYCFSRNIDREGRPVTGVLGGNIYIEMESNGSNCILDMMLVDTDRQRPAFFSHAEHFPIWGKILHSIDDMMFRELLLRIVISLKSLRIQKRLSYHLIVAICDETFLKVSVTAKNAFLRLYTRIAFQT